MKRLERIYYVLTYMFFIYPPFIWGLVLIYYTGSASTEHIVSLIINLILILIISIIILLLIQNKKLHIPDNTERKYLLFGLIGNIVVYFYTFQNLLNMNNIVTIYIVLLIVLAVHMLLISKKFIPLELWILLPIFIVYDYLYLLASGCGWGDYTCNESHAYDPLLKFFFLVILIFVVLYYIYKTLQLKQKDVFKILNIVFVTILSYVALTEFGVDEKFTLTIGILYPFFLLVDFIVKIVNRNFDKKMVVFYIRTFTIFIFFSIVGGTGVFKGDFHQEALSLLVVATYVSLGVNILHGIAKIDTTDVTLKSLFKKDPNAPAYIPLYENDIKKLNLHFEDHIKLFTFDENEFNFKVSVNNEIVGVAHTEVIEYEFSKGKKQARIHFIDAIDKKYLLGLLSSIEKYYFEENIKIITYLLHIEENKMIELLNSKHYHPIEVKKDEYYMYIKTKK